MSNNHQYPYEAQQKINDLERKLEASRRECERLIVQRKDVLLFTEKELKLWHMEQQEGSHYTDGELSAMIHILQIVKGKLTTKSKGGK